MNLTTPALLFPAISLLLLAYTNRFSVLANLIRQLHARHHHNLTDVALRQISNLRKRIDLVRYMQAMGVSSFLFCALSMLLLFLELVLPAQYIFGLSIFLLLLSLLFSLCEIWIARRRSKSSWKIFSSWRPTMQPFEHFSHFAAFWFRNDDACPLKSHQEAPRDPAWLPGIKKAVKRISAMARFADAA